MEIDYLIKEIHENAVNKGFWEDYEDAVYVSSKYINVYISQFLMLIVGEASEAQEGLRKNDYENFKEELADIVIRTFDLAGGLDIDLESEILAKMSKNRERPYLHGKTF